MPGSCSPGNAIHSEPLSGTTQRPTIVEMRGDCMSTFGTAVVVDVAPGRDLDEVQRGFGSGTAVVRRDPESGWVRVTAHLREIEQVERVKQVLAAVGEGRAAVAEDYDEYGALWVVLAATKGKVRTVHRRYILNADPNDPADVALVLQDFNGIDPRADDVPGRAYGGCPRQLAGSYWNCRTSCEQRQATAIFAAHSSAASREGSSRTV